jgi:hypothetical protein
MLSPLVSTMAQQRKIITCADRFREAAAASGQDGPVELLQHAGALKR